MTRWIYGILMAILLSCILLFGAIWFLQGLVVVLAALALYEFFHLVHDWVPERVRLGAILFGTVLTAYLIFCQANSEELMGLLALIIMGVFAGHFRVDLNMDRRLLSVALTWLGVCYVAILISYWGRLLMLDEGRFWGFILLAATFGADTGAYITGHAIGRHKLAPELSPGKTVEGYFGGILGGMIGVGVVWFLFHSAIQVGWLFLLGGLCGIVGPIGDLSESLLKRAVGQKDSGFFIPGHGGLLDRVDALLFTGPVVYYFATLHHG